MKTVNETYADNTTYALSTGLILPHSWNCDSSTLAAYGFSALLGSRLHRDLQVFTLLLSSLITFYGPWDLPNNVQVYN
ncbi:hypothetical protein IMG5_061260 [Ichthyophthirius multifiliis]|uniref:Uncharacterized protein n=1 Tax=Ichthyophthirius multifiliis TaxID=5932 RepID=G0QNT6_ICHMU|nr:hypothetical protein IMG5_061260 [Ichthyophthirius multifiliis]EGR33127.1 hypothetical protein IMG5_061260 [Ichthyophthirius multifiliis]|eukprot:XP_004037113.1 hypothetical protein IMG5_061260 [Ichthyophthirius multifiliis]